MGGGILGDYCAFAASIIKRGVNFINIPTTLLAQVDSSIGGKTGVNSVLGKNLIGTFYQPKVVISDVEILKSLPKLKEWHSEKILSKFENEHGMANSRARLRMTTLYQVAAANKGIVVGTGNKVEDFGVGFYTKYGDGGVDISPIADCNKSEVWELGKELGIVKEII